MESDPWADVPPSPQPSTPRPGGKETSPQFGSTRVIPDQPKLDIPQDEEQQPEASSSKLPSSPLRTSIVSSHGMNPESDGLDDFDDFDESAPNIATDVNEDEDGFGDFGDFEEGDFAETPSQTVGVDPDSVPAQFRSLHLNPFPSRPDLSNQLSTLLSPLYPSSSTSSPQLTSEAVRQQPPARQFLLTSTSQDAYIQLASPPQLKALDWTRSRVRREHLINMGIPVNLDEVDSHRLSSLPPLNISMQFTKDRMSMPPPSSFGPLSAKQRNGSLDEGNRVGGGGSRKASTDMRREGSGIGIGVKGKGKEISNGSSNGMVASPVSVTGEGKYGIGERPELDLTKAEELCGIEEDQLSLLSPARLKQIQDELVQHSAQASALLAWSLQFKDAQSQDGATYNGMISELIANAAKAKSAQQSGSGGVFRRVSNRRPASMSGGSTPRVASPAMR